MTIHDNSSKRTILPAHIETTVAAIARLHAEHHKRATPFQRFTEGLTARAGKTSFVILLTAVVAGWIMINLLIRLNGGHPFDEPPFVWLELFVSLAALYMTTLILSTQRRDDELASHREQLALELAMLSDQKLYHHFHKLMVTTHMILPLDRENLSSTWRDHPLPLYLKEVWWQTLYCCRTC